MGRLAMRLLESEPSDIEQWCAQVRQVDSRKAKRMLDPLVDLNYSKMSDDLVKQVEDTLFYGMFGYERAAQLTKS